ncbi:MAG: class I tRNA ligase family protein, partial [Undibacterium sp.]|nr:class I tRNA ligase family protein [Undibacterium sp.]
ILAHYETFEFHPVIAKLQSFCSEDLGSFYLDILKDRLYTSGINSRARRSAQTAIWHITQSLLRLMAPALSFTAEEAWKDFASSSDYANSDETIFTQTYYALPEIAHGAELLTKYTSLREIRAEVTKQLEEIRVSGAIGSSLQAELVLKTTPEKFELLNSFADDLKFAFITSSANVEQVASAAEEQIIVTASKYQKCERCWHYRADVGGNNEHATLCGRCVSNLFGTGEVRRYA